MSKKENRDIHGKNGYLGKQGKEKDDFKFPLFSYLYRYSRRE